MEEKESGCERVKYEIGGYTFWVSKEFSDGEITQTEQLISFLIDYLERYGGDN